MKCRFVFFWVLTLLVAGCMKPGERRRVSALLSHVDSVMDARPDSALTLLDSLEADSDRLSTHFLMQCRLRRLNAYNKLDTVFTAAHVVQAKTLAGHFDDKGTDNERMLAHYLLGRTYADTDKAPQAIDCYLDAVSRADTTSADCDFAILGRVYTQMAEVFHRQLLFTYEIEARRQAIRHFLCAKDTFYAIYHQGMMADVYILMNKRDSAEILSKKTIRSFLSQGNVQNALEFSTTLMYLYADKKNKLSDLKKLIDLFETKSDLFDMFHELPPTKRHYYYYKGKYYEGVNSLDSAEYYYRKMLRPNMSFVEKDPLYRGLLSIFQKRHQADSIAKYAQLFCMANDSSITIKDQQQTAQLSASYDYHFYKDRVLEKEKEAYKNWLTILVLSFIFILVVCLGALFIRRYRQLQERKHHEMQERHQQEVARLKSELDKATAEYAEKTAQLQQLEETHKFAVGEAIQALADYRKEQETSQAEIDKAQLTIKQMDTRFEHDKAILTEEIGMLKAKIEEMKQRQGMSSFVEHSQQLADSPIFQKLKTLDAVRKPLNKPDEVALEKVFFECYPDMMHDLRQCTKINKSEQMTCLLTSLGFQPHSICNLTGNTSSQVSNARSKVNENLFNDRSASTLQRNLIEKYNIYMP